MARAAQKRRLRRDKGSGGRFAYETLRRRILSLALPPGQELDENRLVRELGISRTPVREALIRLASEGLVVVLPNRGARVAPMDLPHLQAHLEAFDLMQRTATRLAARRCSPPQLERLETLVGRFEDAVAAGDTEGMIDKNWDFHRAIAEACGNHHIEKAYTDLLNDGLRISRLAMAYECYGSRSAFDGHVKNIVNEHRAIVDAIRRGDADAAEQLARSHANLARKRVLEYLAINFGSDISLD